LSNASKSFKTEEKLFSKIIDECQRKGISQ